MKGSLVSNERVTIAASFSKLKLSILEIRPRYSNLRPRRYLILSVDSVYLGSVLRVIIPHLLLRDQLY